MEYADPYPSSVPHAILVPHTFTIDTIFYVSSLIVEILFTIFVLIFFAASIFFSFGNHKLLLEEEEKKGKKGMENIICQVLQKTDYLQKLEDDSSESYSHSSSSAHEKTEKRADVETQIYAQKLRLLERRIVYMCVFTTPWVLCVNQFATDIFLVVVAAIFIALVIAFNILRSIPNWKITILLYIIPALAAFGPFMTSKHNLYDWTPVLKALEI